MTRLYVIAFLLFFIIGGAFGYLLRFIQGEEALAACQVELAILQFKVDTVRRATEGKAYRFHGVLLSYWDDEMGRPVFINEEGKPCALWGRWK